MVETGSKDVPNCQLALEMLVRKVNKASLHASTEAHGPHLIRALIALLRSWIDDISISPWLAHL